MLVSRLVGFNWICNIIILSGQHFINGQSYFCIMLNDEEKGFIVFWEANRLRQRKFVKYIQYGLPLGLVIGFSVFVNLLSGWDKRAFMVVNADPSLILVLLAGVILIIIFISIFTVRHRWEMNEQRYRELLAKRDKE